MGITKRQTHVVSPPFTFTLSLSLSFHSWLTGERQVEMAEGEEGKQVYGMLFRIHNRVYVVLVDGKPVCLLLFLEFVVRLQNP